MKSFRQGIYGDESYLTHTLPVKKSDIYLSKFFTSVIISGISIAVIILCALIAYYTEERWQYLKQMFSSTNVFTKAVLAIILIFLELINLIQCGFTGIILGYRRNSGKAVFSILFALLAVTTSSIIMLICMALTALISEDFKQLFTSNPDISQKVFYYSIAIYALIISGFALLNIKTLNKGVNIE